MLNKEHVQEDTIAMSFQEMEAEQEVDESWKVMTIRGPKRRTEGNMKLMENKLINSKEQEVPTTSRFTALETDSNTPRNENRTKTIYENKPRAVNNDQKEKMKYTGQVCSTTEEPQEELNMKTKVELNLKNHTLSPQQPNIKKEETIMTPSIINGRTSRKDTRRDIKQKTPLQNKVKLNTSKNTVMPACRREKILIIGDGHVRGLSEKISNCLDNTFTVTGITKPNADIEAVTSPVHLKTENLTKKRPTYILW
jgi:hypothetical protein